MKKLTALQPAGCDIPVTVLEPGGDPTGAAISCSWLVSTNVATGVMGTAAFNCDTVGVGVITLEHSNATTLVTEPVIQPHWEDNATDTLTINCVPPATTATPTSTPTPTPTSTNTPTPTITATPTPCPPEGCPVGGIAELPEVAGTPLETEGSSGPSAGVLAGVAAGTAGVVGLGGAAWYARRRWLR